MTLLTRLFAQYFGKLYLILRQKEPKRQDITNFSFKMFKIVRSLRSSKCLKTTVVLTFTTKKKALLLLRRLDLFSTGNTSFWVNLVQELKVISLSWNFIPRLIQMCRIPWWYSLFCFGNAFSDKFGSKNQNCQFELKFCTRLIWICRIMWKINGVHFFCFRPEKPFLGKSGQKNQNC